MNLKQLNKTVTGHPEMDRWIAHVADTLNPVLRAQQAPGAKPITPQGAAQTGAIYQGAGVPGAAYGGNGDFYFRTDTPGTSGQLLYVKSAGAWVAVASVPASLLTAKGGLITATGPSAPVMLPVGSDGQVLTADSSQADGIKWAAASAGGNRQTLYEVDYTTLVTQNLKTGGDGAKTVDGKAVFVAGTVGATTNGITNGVGLVIQGNANGDNYLGGRFIDLAPTAVPQFGGIELWVRLTSANVSIAGEWSAVGIVDCSTTAALFNWFVFSGNRWNFGTEANQCWLSLSQDGSTAFTQTTNLSDDVIVVRMNEYCSAECFSGVWSGGWPAVSSLRFRARFPGVAAPASGSQTTSVTHWPDPGTFGFILNAGSPGAGANTKITVTNLRIIQ